MAYPPTEQDMIDILRESGRVYSVVKSMNGPLLSKSPKGVAIYDPKYLDPLVHKGIAFCYHEADTGNVYYSLELRDDVPSFDIQYGPNGRAIKVNADRIVNILEIPRTAFPSPDSLS